MSTTKTHGSRDPLSQDDGTRRVELDFLKRLLDSALQESIAATHRANKRRREPSQEQAVRDRLAVFDSPAFGRLAEEIAAHVPRERSFGKFSDDWAEAEAAQKAGADSSTTVKVTEPGEARDAVRLRGEVISDIGRKRERR